MRYAAHRVFSIHPPYQYTSQQSVVLAADGIVISVEPFVCELPQTVWLGGVIVLAPQYIQREDGEPFAVYLHRLAEVSASDLPLRAIFICPFDFVQMDFLPQSRIRLLA